MEPFVIVTLQSARCGQEDSRQMGIQFLKVENLAEAKTSTLVNILEDYFGNSNSTHVSKVLVRTAEDSL